MESTCVANDWPARLRAAIAYDLPYAERSRNPDAESERSSAVLILLARDAAGEPALLLTKRTEGLRRHQGQIAFPGGVTDPEDLTAERTALRETEEEVGIAASLVQVVGELPQLSTTTGFVITPVVAWSEVPLADIHLRLSLGELEVAFWAGLTELRSAYRREFFEIVPLRYPIHVFAVGPHRVWGATGAIIKNLLDRLDRIE